VIAEVPWIAWAVILPLLGAVASLFAGARWASLPALAVAPALAAIAVALGLQVVRHGPQRHALGGWEPPLGIVLYADGLSALMVLMTAAVGAAVTAFAAPAFARIPGADPATARRPGLFWPLWLFCWGGLHALFLSRDLFNVYVTLEVVSLSAVALVVLAGERAAIVAGTRYLLVAFLGSVGYLLGVVLLYSAHGAVDFVALHRALAPGVVAWTAAAAMTAGLALKGALFPVHGWLPPAHARAPTPVSALLSALVVKTSFYLLLRFSIELFPAGVLGGASLVLGACGAGAILWGSWQALRQPRLKLLVAYSTVAQLGYLFLFFPLAVDPAAAPVAYAGAVYLAVSHAAAKAALFLSAGAVAHALGHDRIDGLNGLGRRLPVSTLAFAAAALTIMGLPPSGGFAAKWLLLTAAIAAGGWGWVGVIVAGGLLSAAYVFRVLERSLTPGAQGAARPVPRAMEWSALLLALASVALGVASEGPLALLDVGNPYGPGAMVP
jgi:multicomponent Na+:H+ antiporter subunit D